MLSVEFIAGYAGVIIGATCLSYACIATGLFALILFSTFNNFLGGVFMALMDAYGAFAPSLKAPGVADWLSTHVTAQPPVAILNATAFSANSRR